MSPNLESSLSVTRWLNCAEPPDTGGRVVVIEAFQMLCPGCVSTGLPQAMRIEDLFDHDRVLVLGLHSVFEHHEAQGSEAALAAFLHEYRITFPVGMDAPVSGSPIPRTMQALQLRGTPSLLLFDAQGRLRHRHFGHVEDLVIGAQIAGLMVEADATITPSSVPVTPGGCGPDGCPVP